MEKNIFEKAREGERISELLKERDNLRQQLSISLKDNVTIQKVNNILKYHATVLEKKVTDLEEECKRLREEGN